MATTITQRGAATETGTQSRVPVLDGIRGLAVLLVMVSHFCLHGGMAASGSWIDQQFLRVTGSAWIGVDLFFVMSGFLIAISPRRPSR